MSAAVPLPSGPVVSASVSVAGRGAVVEEPFEEFFLSHAGRAVRLASLLGSREAEDVAQEAFSRVYGRGKAAQDHQGRWSRSYLDRVIINLVKDSGRRGHVVRRAFHLLHPTLVGAAVVGSVDTAVTDAVVVQAAVDRLPLKRRAAVVLRYHFDLPYAEIAEALGVTEGAAKSYVSKAIHQLETLIGDEHRSTS